VTGSIRKLITTKYRRKDGDVVVITNGANTDLFKPIGQSEAIDKIGLDTSYNYVCFVGNLAPWQGVEYVVDCAPNVLKECPMSHFIIVGDGSMKKELMDKVGKMGLSSYFIFTGKIKYEDVPLYINSSDICVIPKKPLSSGYSPLKLYECMSCGKPIVASLLPGFEILETANSGLLVNPEDPDDLAKGIIRLLADTSLRAEMGKNAREYVVKNHSWKSVARKVADVCESAIRK
jgi:glycosyltransferase involved in cell wall biosynthesis